MARYIETLQKQAGRDSSTISRLQRVIFNIQKENAELRESRDRYKDALRNLLTALLSKQIDIPVGDWEQVK